MQNITALSQLTEGQDGKLRVNAAKIDFATGTAYENSVKVSAITSVGGLADANASGVLRIYIADVAYYIPFYAAAVITGE